MTQLILASSSASRLRLLKSVGINPIVMVSGVDEDAKEFDSLLPAELVMALAILKAHTVKKSAPEGSIIIGCDSTFEFNGKSLGKPGTRENAISRCKELSGSYGYLHTGHCLIDLKQGIEISECSTSKVQFAQMSDTEIVDYVDSGEPLQVAGGFTLDGLSAPFITNIEGDPSGIIGLSLPVLRKMIISLGYSWPDFKNI
ncbi:MAG: septum formation inhibitor Maf [Actinobacteria bacterium]|jgi:septum formation protein|nr:septum formation inhibitor Maf [Actinomycetota bacterium]